MQQIRILTINAAAALLGLTTGAMLLIGTGLVPYWASLPPADYRTTFSAMDLGRIMLPLGIGSFVITATALALLIREPGARRTWVATATVCWAIPMLAYPFVFEPLNLRIAGNAVLTSDEVFQLLHRWQALHWARTALGLAAFVSMLAGVTSHDPPPR
jgi:hypothetical protein